MLIIIESPAGLLTACCSERQATRMQRACRRADVCAGLDLGRVIRAIDWDAADHPDRARDDHRCDDDDRNPEFVGI